MSKTATCFFALGVCVALAAACGDDDGDGDGGGGSGGQGGSGGSAGSGGSGGGGAGQAGANNVGGAAGQTNVAGSSGVAGSGTAGSGTAGSGQAGSGTIEPPDAGPDGSVEADASVPPDGGSSQPADSGVNGDCTGFATGIPNIAPQNSQDVVIARVIFNADGDTATVVLRVINAFQAGGDQVLCWGSTNSECASVDDGIEGSPSPVGAEILVTVGTELDPIDVAAGELLFAADTPQTDPAVFAYVNWGDHLSADVDDAGPLPTLEGFADAQNLWTSGQSIDLDNNDNAFFGLGDTDVGTGFDGCTADQF